MSCNLVTLCLEKRLLLISRVIAPSIGEQKKNRGDTKAMQRLDKNWTCHYKLLVNIDSFRDCLKPYKCFLLHRYYNLETNL